MGYKDILVYADSTKYAAPRLDTAARLALSHDAHLTALHVDPAPYMQVDLMSTGVAPQIRQWQKTVQNEKAGKVRKIVDDIGARHGIEIEWRRQEGGINDVIISQAAYADLVVVSQAGNPFDLEQPIDPSLGVIALSSGRPVLVVPNRTGEFQVGKNVLIAWKPCAEAARAVHDALPLLQHARSVKVIEVNPGAEAGRGRLVGAEIARHLARHGVNVTATSMNESHSSDGETILAQATEIRADLIVMGGYGHSRFREVVFGGVTRHILGHHHIPVFMAH
jgi:nucleotide-binding universal stress UspA family protein